MQINSIRRISRNVVLGFSLIEMLVGVAIGLIGLLAVFQMLNTWDARKRSTTAGSDAQIAGGISMFSLERELKLAGYGFGQAATEIMGCTVTAINKKLSSPDVSFKLMPIEITKTANLPDQISVTYGSSAFFSSARTFSSSDGTTKKTDSRNGFLVGDKVIVAEKSATPKCTMMEVSGLPAGDELTIQHAANSAGSSAPFFNASSVIGTAYTSGFIFNMGAMPQRKVWRIADGRTLVWSETINSPTAINQVADGVVNMKAQYGVNTATPPEISIKWQNAAPVDWTKLIAIRVGLLARSQQYEKTAVTSATPSWSGSTAPPGFESAPFEMLDIGGTTDAGAAALGPTNWRNYRYRVYERVIPIRNLIWGEAP